jgi:diphthine synthase
MLTLIGLGLFDEKDLTLKGMEEAKKADKVYIELYTTLWHGNIKNLEKLLGKKIDILKRKDLEENSGKILEDAKNQNISIFIGGDPLVATTHSAILLEAKKQGIKTRIIHNASIISAIAETGLHIYKFGPSVTIPFPEKIKGKLPESIYDVIKMNKTRGLHTLCLLDVDADQDKFMSANEGMKILLELESKRKEDVVDLGTEVVIFARVGSENPMIVYGKVKNLIEKTFGEPPMILILPGILHFTEKEYLSLLKNNSL